MVCTDCENARASTGLWAFFNNRVCVHCAARLIQRIQRLAIPNGQKAQRCRAVLDDAIAAGLPEQVIRTKAKAEALAITPKPEKP